MIGRGIGKMGIGDIVRKIGGRKVGVRIIRGGRGKGREKGKGNARGIKERGRIIGIRVMRILYLGGRGIETETETETETGTETGSVIGIGKRIEIVTATETGTETETETETETLTGGLTGTATTRRRVEGRRSRALILRYVVMS
jgi:hypothetical protein